MSTSTVFDRPSPPEATISTKGLMSSEDKTNLDGFEIVYSVTQTSSPTTGMIWLKPKE